MFPTQVGKGAITVTWRSRRGLTSGTQTGSFVIPGVSCLGPFVEVGPSAKTITWNTGQTSTFSIDRLGSNLLGSTVLAETGRISSGLFAGDNAVEVVVNPALNPVECLSSRGVTDRVGTVALHITGL